VEHVVGISELALSAEPGDSLITYSLGSCVGLALHDPVAGVGGLLHALMPNSSADPEKAERLPAMYADTGARALLQAMFDLGASRRSLVAYVAGAASQLDTQGLFRIGERNHAVVRKVLWKNGILIAAEDVGGSASRTVTLDVGTGRFAVKSGGSTYVLTPSQAR
jgi:chemotaxis protein CheD